jgi:lipoprotein-anchoring transpeptidase ErfK/SrfK
MRRQEKQSSTTGPEAKPKGSLWRTVGVIAAGAILGLAAINIALSALLTGAMYPGVTLAGHDVSFKTRAETVALVKKLESRHTLTIQLGEKRYVVKSDQLGANRDTAASVDAAYRVGRETPFPLIGITSSLRNGRTGFAYSLDTAVLKRFAQKLTSDIGRAPVNAKVEVVNGEIVATPDQDGVEINQAELTKVLQSALAEGEDKSVALEPSSVKADVGISATESVISEAKDLIAQDVTLKYAERIFKPSPSSLASWLVFPIKADNGTKPALAVDVDEAKVRGYVQSVANEIDQAAVNKKVTIKNGVSTTDQEGADGLAMNQDEAVAALVAAMRNKAAVAYGVTTRPVAYKTQYNRVTTLDVGRYIEINLTTQQLWVYQDSQVIYSSPITSGATGMGFPTVTGLFSIYSKATNIWLDGRAYGERYNYRVLVDYWMPFHAGYGLHDAWRWRSSFGGQDYYYNGSHGCVNLPIATAAFIYNWADIGTPVWVHN